MQASTGQAHTDIHRKNIIVKDLRDVWIALNLELSAFSPELDLEFFQ
jgi:hypothetical protein